MTRFQREIAGDLGVYWQKSAIKESENAVLEANRDAVVEADGAIRWISSGNYIPDDFCEKLEYQGYDFDREATRIAREKQIAEFMEEYRQNQRLESEEEFQEMRAAFGTGTSVVDIITGREIAL